MGRFVPLVEESKDLSSCLFAASLLVSHDAVRCGDDDVTELTGWQKVDDPLLNVVVADVESWADDTALIQSAIQFNNNLL